jgi:hypothetical protein
MPAAIIIKGFLNQNVKLTGAVDDVTGWILVTASDPV